MLEYSLDCTFEICEENSPKKTYKFLPNTDRVNDINPKYYITLK